MWYYAYRGDDMNFRKISKYAPFTTLLLFLLFLSISDRGFFIYFIALLLSLLVYGLGKVIDVLYDILGCLKDNTQNETGEND